MANWNNDKKFQELLNKAAKNAYAGSKLAAQITEAFVTRYGVTHSDIDADEIIDVIDYGFSNFIDSVDVDQIMASGGYPKGMGGKDAE